MRAHSIRYNEKNGGGKPTERYLDDLCGIIVSEAATKGFLTDSHRLTGTAIKIGLHQSSFRIDTVKLGHNARVTRSNAYGYSHRIESPKGYKRTNVPTWEQREDFNHLINDIFDRFGLVATIVSGNYTVRTRKGRVNDWNYGGDRNSQCAVWQGDACRDIVTEKEAREMLDSDRLEAEHRERTRETRLEKAREYRAKRKAIAKAKRVKLTARRYYVPHRLQKHVNKTMGKKAFTNLMVKNPDAWRYLKVEMVPGLTLVQGGVA